MSEFKFFKKYLFLKVVACLIVFFFLAFRLETSKVLLIGFNYNEKKRVLEESYFITNPPRDKEELLELITSHKDSRHLKNINMDILNVHSQYYYKENLTFNRWYISGFFHGGLDPLNVVKDPQPFESKLLAQAYLESQFWIQNGMDWNLPCYSLYNGINETYCLNGWGVAKNLIWKKFPTYKGSEKW